ncbi:hypothetical protein [Solimicrobium silvestre]|uniref:Uncharacterized protein n=1 Tax=Solimicrobium silvestre TaxID=2099400 RepID=A0A2S9GYE4_9BURK|nr:hypothetical protein [Solimicrobium silvestre]PRC92747.1 hypothetical protein S2091_2477 [Solimicrobium silvestre]
MPLNFKWTPGVGVNQDSLKRMLSSVKKPKEPMGESWFMGDEREMHDALINKPLGSMSVFEIERPLEDIASGTSSFGPMAEWENWFEYLLPNLIPVAANLNDTSLHELLITALMTQHPEGISARPYPGYREDVLQTLGQVLMSKSKWKGNEIALERMLIQKPYDMCKGWGWWNASGDLSSTLFLCLKYLETSEIHEWTTSILEIDDPHWRAQILIWLVGSADILKDELKQPFDLHEHVPSIGWNWSWCLKGNFTGIYDGSIPLKPFISNMNSSAFKSVIREILIDDKLGKWIDSISRIEHLKLEALPFIVDVEHLY